ncbi:MAG: hypothetical protein JWR59_607 [Brevundimonas sp.]|nr:hypothetical protein [Brevundimonas sp.]
MIKPEQIGVFSPGGWGEGLEPYEGWLGQRVGYVVDNADENQVMLSKNFLWHVGSLADESAETPTHLVLGVPMLTKDRRGQFKEANAGTFDAVYKQHAIGLAKHLRRTIGGVEYRLIVRLAWECNGTWMPWFAGTTPAQIQGFTTLWRRIVGIYRAVDPRFEFSFCTTLGKQGMSDATLAYPGDDVVDYVDLDVYDEDHKPALKRSPDKRFDDDYLNAANGLVRWREFALAHGKPLAFSEWGVGKDTGIDNPIFVERFAAFLDETPNVAWACYFERLKTTLADGSKPQSAAAYKRLFGPQPKPVEPPAPPPKGVWRGSIIQDGKTYTGELPEA